ncbi:MAG: hypothetical protein H7A49_17610 [Akkermansiaceae bacterium]|nr:hypothetical protein [Akkermansiaceae bacterium]MCP5545715.1 hypothetical protein [Akkermansiaceae bacterium]
MSDTPTTPRRFEQLFQDLEDGCITGSDHAELMELLRSRPEARGSYIRHMRFSSLLYAKAESIAELEGTSAVPARVRNKHPFFGAMVAAAALVALAAFIASFFVIPNRPPASVKAAPDTVWSFRHGGLDEDERFLPGTAISVEGGSLDVRLESGVRFIVEGPADVSIAAQNAIRMESGRVWVRAEGGDFTVRTQRLDVVDLGTEFGVSSFPEIDDEVHVASGRVRVVPKHKTFAPMELAAGQAARADVVGRLRSIAYDATRFQTKLPNSPTYIHWSFDEADDRGFPSSGSGIPGAPMAVYSLDRRWMAEPVSPVPGRYGNSLRLDGPDLFAQADFPGIEGNVARSIAFWIRAMPVESEQAISLVSWGLAGGEGRKWVVTTSQEGTSMGVTWGGPWAGAEIPWGASVLDGKWHHLCYVFTGHSTENGGPELIHYLDGEPIVPHLPKSTIPIDTDCGAKGAWPLTIGTQLWTTPLRPTFNGCIDELYVFRGALNHVQIRQLIVRNRLDSFSSSAVSSNPDIKR